jgi:hypothetical protein
MVQVNMESKMATTYDIFLSIDGKTIELGSLVFNTGHGAVLSLAGDSPEHLALKERWAEIDAQDTLEVMRTLREKNDDGSWTRYNTIENIAKDSVDYPPAIVQFLELNFGYLLSRQPLAVSE